MRGRKKKLKTTKIMENTKFYCQPQVWCSEVRTEHGFATSGFSDSEGTEDVTTNGAYIGL